LAPSRLMHFHDAADCESNVVARAFPPSPGISGIDAVDGARSRQRSAIADRIVEILTNQNEGIHISEMSGLNLPEINKSISPYLVFSIATLDPRIRSNVAQYIYLSEWGEARRLTPLEAVKACLHDSVSLARARDHSEFVNGVSQRGFRSGVLAASTPWLVRSDRPSSIVAPNRHITRKKQNTLPDVQRLDLAYVSCAAGPARPDGKLKWRKSTAPPAASPSARAGRAASRRRSQNAPRRIPRPPPAKG